MLPDHLTEEGVVYKSLDFLGYPHYVLGTNQELWSSGKGRWRKRKFYKGRGGYLIYPLCYRREVRAYPIHRLVLLTFVGPCPDGMECRHLDGNPANNHLKNLQWGTKEENAQDRFAHGTSNRGMHYCQGEDHAQAKLSDEDVLEIRRKFSAKVNTARELADRYSVSMETVYGITGGRTWQHLGGERTNRVRTELTDQQVMEIRRLYAERKYNQFQLANMFSVDQTSISRYILGKSRASAQ